MENKKIKTINELKDISEKSRKENKTVVTTNGVFDIIHIGHIRYLHEAKKLGDKLIVGINSDISVKRIKGPERPLNNENDRAEALAALQCVDYVTVFNEENPIKVLDIIKPNIHVKGGDYNINQIIEKGIIEKNNGRIVLIPEVKGYATTNLIRKIIGLYKEN